MNILITGSNGLVGRTVVEELKRDHYLIGCGKTEHAMSNVDIYYQWDIGTENIPEDLEKRKIDGIIHLAACKALNDLNLELSFSNLVGTHRVFNYCIQSKCKKAILFSGLPIVEHTSNKPVLENAPFNPPTMYHATKVAQEMMFRQLQNHGVCNIIMRIPSPIAPDMNEKTIFTIFGNSAMQNRDILINGKGTRRQNYIDTRDIAIVCRELLESEKANGVYNIGSKLAVSNLELAQKWIDVTGSDSRIVFSGEEDIHDDENWLADLSRIENEIGYKQHYSIEQTMKEYMGVRKYESKANRKTTVCLCTD